MLESQSVQTLQVSVAKEMLIDETMVSKMKDLVKKFDQLVEKQKASEQSNDETLWADADNIRREFNKQFGPGPKTLAQLIKSVQGPYKQQALKMFLNMNFVGNWQSDYGRTSLGRMVVDGTDYEDTVAAINTGCTKEESQEYTKNK